MVAAPPQALTFALSFFAYYAYVGMFAPYASLYFAKEGMNGVQIGILMSMMQVTRIFGRICGAGSPTAKASACWCCAKPHLPH